MKSVLLSLCFLIVVMTAQPIYGQAPQRMTLVESATGTWCTFCPGSALAVDELLSNGNRVAVVNYHDAGSDPFVIPAGNERVNYYGVTTFPTAFFDGQNPYVGGHETFSLYGNYLPSVISALALPPLFEVGITWSQIGPSVAVSIDVSEIGTYTGSPLVVHLVATESHIQHNWLGLTEVNHVTRVMLPDQNGTALNLSNGFATITQTLAIDSGWNQDNMELIAWVQNPVTKVVHQAAKSPLLGPSGQHDPGVVNIPNAPSGISCIDNIAPQIIVQNFGSDDLESMTVEYTVSNGVGNTFSAMHTWTGNLSFGAQKLVNLPQLNFSPVGTNTLLIKIISATDTNGNIVTDTVTTNNALSATWEYERVSGDYDFTLTTDEYGYETYWQITNSSGNVVASGGNTNVGPNGAGAQVGTANDPGAYPNNTTITETIPLNGNDCYDLLVVDDYNDGFCCAYGNGSFTLSDPNGVVVSTGGQFAGTEETNWFVGNPAVEVGELLQNMVALYPNPNQGQFLVEIPASLLVNCSLSIYTMDGRLVDQLPIQQTSTNVKLDFLSSGMYLVKISSRDKVVVKKMAIR